MQKQGKLEIRYWARLVAMLAVALFFGGAEIGAQGSAFKVQRQDMVRLADDITSMWIDNGTLYLHTEGLVLCATRDGENVFSLVADTMWLQADPDVDYAVRKPDDGKLYFTKPDKNGYSRLYELRVRKKRKPKIKQVRMHGMAIEHPTFSADGKIMIFASDNSAGSMGGYDLWYSLWERGRWQKPVNMGRRINTEMDEMSPLVCGKYLLFNTNGRDVDSDEHQIYSTQLISNRVNGDTIGVLQIGRSVVQKLPFPINCNDADNSCMVIDTLNDCAYWLSSRDSVAETVQLYSFSGHLKGVRVTGQVTDAINNPIGGAKVQVYEMSQPVCNAVTNSMGYYELYLKADTFYDVCCRADGSYTDCDALNTTLPDNERLIAELHHNIQLGQLPFGQPLYFYDLFGPDGDVELSERGKDYLMRLIDFVRDNPAISIQAVLFNNMTANNTYNKLLTDQRLLSLELYLKSHLPVATDIVFANGHKSGVGSSIGAGRSVLTVVLRKPE
ncbi:MAG: carboxypeptidase regulatory-like domain-containing protein [Bacteroidales bacterium]|nr:carboxypeptidase regulatory-like domain-containing protein [Bacteroidales bacterium]